ncbi:MAG: hypothetical protein V3U27_21520 [Candidatus Tectomicrobia bacterium]
MNELTAQDHRNIYIFLQRTPITGEQAVGMAVLLQKLENILQPEPSRDGAKEETVVE